MGPGSEAFRRDTRLPAAMQALDSGCMGEIGRGHDDRIDIVAPDRGFGVTGDVLRTAGVGNRPRARGVHVADTTCRVAPGMSSATILAWSAPIRPGADNGNSNAQVGLRWFGTAKDRPSFASFLVCELAMNELCAPRPPLIRSMCRRRDVAVMRFHVTLDVGLQIGHGFAPGHQIRDLLARLLALAEIGGDGTRGSEPRSDRPPPWRA